MDPHLSTSENKLRSKLGNPNQLMWVMIFSTLFILINTLLIAKEIYWFMAVPVALLFIYIAFVSLDTLLLIIVFFTPLATTIQDPRFGVSLSLPTEPLLFGVTIIYILRIFYEGRIERKILYHPVTLAILFNLVWIFLTNITSSLPIVSWKFTLSRLWFIIPFYFVALTMFKDKRNMRKYIWLYTISFSIVILYTLVIHAMDNFSEHTAHIAMTPFYNDHTSYGAMLAMYIPPLILFAFNKEYSRHIRYVAYLVLLIFIVGLIFSYTRAAWLSIGGALLALVIFLLRIRTASIVSIIGVGIILLLINQKDILMKLESSRFKNHKNRDIEQRLQSIGNVTTDPSNTERFNRWESAIRMFKERPFFGWGAGTYQFNYAAFQISSEKTQISTNSGERGNAHSEYIGPLAETGIVGLLSVVGIIVTTLLTAGKLIYHSPNKEIRRFALVIILGLITYFIHGTLNNFLDTDKASAPFWGFIAILVALDIYNPKEEKSQLT